MTQNACDKENIMDKIKKNAKNTQWGANKITMWHITPEIADQIKNQMKRNYEQIPATITKKRQKTAVGSETL